MELRQLRYFVTLAEELHFGRAAAREHIVQSALSQRLQRLERELGVTLMDRTTHHVRLTAAGAVFLIDARQILAHVERAAVAAQRAARSRPSLRVGSSMPATTMWLILHDVQTKYDLEITRSGQCAEQFQRLVDGRLVGIGQASLAPPAVAPSCSGWTLGVLVARTTPSCAVTSGGHAGRGAAAAVGGGPGPGVQPVRDRAVPLGGFHPDPLPGNRRQHPRLGRPRRGATLRDVCAPASCLPAPSGIVWRSLWLPCRAIGGRCCGAQATPRSM
jgi:hypothetical protein